MPHDRQLIRMFDRGVPHVGDRIDHEGRAWVVTEVAMISGRWAAWGRPVAADAVAPARRGQPAPGITTVLIVDDEPDMRLLVRSVLEVANHGLAVVGEAGDGAEAIAVWRDLDGPPVPDVVVLDNRMPTLSGLDAARRILEERPGQIVILYSAFLDDAVRREAATAGVAACVSKAEIDRLPGVVRALVDA